jgi:DNA-directed RNA polymerase subunit RPC12/RpoP
MSKYKIEVRNTGEYRDATDAEVEAIDEHIEDYPQCQGKKIQDDDPGYTVLATRLLRCRACGVRVKVKERLI